MSRLVWYLLSRFLRDAAVLFGVVGVLLFLLQCLRLFDSIAERDQGLFTLFGFAALGLPKLAILLVSVAWAMGLGRALSSLAGSGELAAVHAGGLVAPLLRAIALFVGLGAIVALALTHVVEPLSTRRAGEWSAEIAADLVTRGLTPNRFTTIAPEVTVMIGGRAADGRLLDFFADDRRGGAAQRSYFAQSAELARDETGYVLRLKDGAAQQMSDQKQLSQIAFGAYDLALGRLANFPERADAPEQQTSLEIWTHAPVGGEWPEATVRLMLQRSLEGLRVVVLCLAVAAATAFPSGRRRGGFSVELAVLGLAGLERGVTSYLPTPSPALLLGGAAVLGLGAGLALLARLKPFGRPGRALVKA